MPIIAATAMRVRYLQLDLNKENTSCDVNVRHAFITLCPTIERRHMLDWLYRDLREGTVLHLRQKFELQNCSIIHLLTEEDFFSVRLWEVQLSL